MLCRICVVQIQPRRRVLYLADCMASTRQHELDHTDQECICPEISRSRAGNRSYGSYRPYRLSVRGGKHLLALCCSWFFLFLFLQSSAIVIRGLATGEIRRGNRMRAVWREARAAVASAFVLSVASFVRVLLTPGATTVATLAVSIAMGATVIGAVMFGTSPRLCWMGWG